MGEQTFNWYLVARKLGEPLKMGKRKTALAGAPIDDAQKWNSINWKEAQRHVRRLQVRIAVVPQLHDEGCEGKKMEQSKITTKSFNQLVLRQAIGCQTSYLE